MSAVVEVCSLPQPLVPLLGKTKQSTQDSISCIVLWIYLYMQLSCV